jgi:hypothetical protein
VCPPVPLVSGVLSDPRVPVCPSAPVVPGVTGVLLGLVGPVLDFLGFLYRALKKKIKTFFKTSQLSKNHGEVWAPVLKNSRSYSVLNFIFFKGIFGDLGKFWSGAALTSPNLVGTAGRLGERPRAIEPKYRGPTPRGCLLLLQGGLRA